METRAPGPRILLVGGGLCGLTAAIFLKEADIPFRIFESSARPTDIGGTVTIFPNGMRVLRDCGLKDAVVSLGASTRDAIIQDHFGRQFASLTMGAIETYSEPTITIRRSLLHRLLIEKAESLGVKIEYGKRVTQVVDHGDRVSVAFDDDTRAEGAILLGADGINSAVRGFVIPEQSAPTYSGLVFFAGFVDDQGIVSKAALNRSAQYVTVGPIGFFGYSCVDHATAPNPSVLWNCYLRQDERIPSTELKAMSDQAVRQRVMAAHQGWHSPILDMIENANSFCKASIFEVVGLNRWSRGRALIIGDAAHAMNPVAGQGANMALEDAQLIVGLLKDPALPVERVFKHFEEVRKPRVTQAAQRAHRSSKRTMIRVGPVMGWIRNRAYSVVTKVIPDRWTNRKFRYEVDRDRKEILKRLAT